MVANPYATVTGLDDDAWWTDAACRVEASEAFFPESRGGKPLSLRSELRAKAICARCAVQPQCLDTALRNGESVGIWGGLTAAERRDLLARMQAAEVPSR
jgi:WhiB family transcriptional regulator, redox-sensing transcriptional regulator